MRLLPETFDAAVTGDVGLDWGSSLRSPGGGQPRERAPVPFSNVVARRPQGWQVLMITAIFSLSLTKGTTEDTYFDFGAE
jgi:hypothetical protein